jgi:hypothetical protein
MINGDYFASRLVSHALENMKVNPKRVLKRSEGKTDFYGIEYAFKADSEGFDVEIEPVDQEKLEEFNRFLKSTQERDFWKKDFLHSLDRNRRKYRKYLGNLCLELNGNNHYHFKGKFKTKSEEKAFFAMLNHVVKVAALYHDPRIKQ